MTSEKEIVIKTDKLTKKFGDFIAANEITFEVFIHLNTAFWFMALIFFQIISQNGYAGSCYHNCNYVSQHMILNNIGYLYIGKFGNNTIVH